MRVWTDVRPTPAGLGPKLRDAMLVTLGPNYARRPEFLPVVLRLRFILRRDAELGAAVPTDEPELVALVRAVTDELVSIVYEDARQVVAIHAAKEYGNVSGVEVSW